MRIWDLETGAVRLLDDGKGYGTHRVWFEGPNALWVATDGGSLARWGLEGEIPKLLQQLAVPGIVVELRSDLMQALVLEAGSGPLWLFHLDTGTTSRVAELGVPPGPPGIAVSPDGRWVLYARGEGRKEADIILVENFE